DVTVITEADLPLTATEINAIALAVWSYRNTAAGDTIDAHQAVMNAANLLTTPVPRAGGKTGNTSLGSTVAYLDANLSAIPANVLNQSFTTAAGIKTNVPGLLDAINPKPVGTVTLTDAQIVTLAAQLGPANIKALANQL